MEKFPIIISLFPHVPPYINFLPLDQEYDPPQPEVSREGAAGVY